MEWMHACMERMDRLIGGRRDARMYDVLMLLMMMLMIVCLIERLLDCFLIGSWID